MLLKIIIFTMFLINISIASQIHSHQIKIKGKLQGHLNQENPNVHWTLKLENPNQTILGWHLTTQCDFTNKDLTHSSTLKIQYMKFEEAVDKQLPFQHSQKIASTIEAESSNNEINIHFSTNSNQVDYHCTKPTINLMTEKVNSVNQIFHLIIDQTP